jgi:serine/threonine-protein kinase RsbW
LQRFLEIESETKNIEKLRKFLRNIFVECGFDARHFNKVFLGVSEAVCNSIIHGNQTVKSKSVLIKASCDGSNLFITIKDEGQGFDHRSIEDPTLVCNLKKEAGRGIFLLKSVSDEVFYDENGSRVNIKFDLKK